MWALLGETGTDLNNRHFLVCTAASPDTYVRTYVRPSVRACVRACVCVLKPREAAESRLPWNQLCLHEE